MGGGPTSWTSSHSTRPIFVNPHIRRPESMQFAEGLQRPLSCFEVLLATCRLFQDANSLEPKQEVLSCHGRSPASRCC